TTRRGAREAWTPSQGRRVTRLPHLLRVRPLLVATNVVPHGCLRARVKQCGLSRRDCGFEIPLRRTHCGLNIDLVCEPESFCLRATTSTHVALHPHTPLQAPKTLHMPGETV